MKKYFSVLAAAFLLLTGCTDEKTASDSSETSESTDFSDSAPESLPVGGITYKGSASGETFLKGLDGKPIEVSEITSLADKDYKPTAVLDENNFGKAECNGFAYAFEPAIFYEKSEHPELFDDDWYIGKDAEKSSEFIRVSAGDKFGSLTVKSARAVFSTANSYLGDGYYYEGSEIVFDGEITLTGWITIPSINPQYPSVILDMSFGCDDEKKLPLSVNYVCNPEGGGYYHVPQIVMERYSDIPEISLGKYSDYDDIDFQGLKEGDYRVKAEITVTDVKMEYGIQGYMGPVTATLVNVKPL